MSHHNYELADEMKKVLNESLGGAPKLGATGEYPDGRYGDRDEGEIRFAVAADVRDRKVLVDFGKPVHSLGLTPHQAVELAEMLHKKAWECRGIDAGR